MFTAIDLSLNTIYQQTFQVLENNFFSNLDTFKPYSGTRVLQLDIVQA